MASDEKRDVQRTADGQKTIETFQNVPNGVKTTMNTIEILSLAGAVLFSTEAASLREALEKALKARANLVRANLVRANLVRANLYGANLSGANLDGANLSGANLVCANLVCANLSGANLSGASLDGANLDGASLDGANLDGANLVRANLYGAKGVSDWLKATREDLCKVLDAAPHEVAGLQAALWAGKVDGSTYTGTCACLVGTIANLRNESHNALKIDLRPDADRPAEQWFLKIRKGDTPLTNPSAAWAAAVIAQWQMERATAKPRRKAKPAAVAP